MQLGTERYVSVPFSSRLYDWLNKASSDASSSKLCQ